MLVSPKRRTLETAIELDLGVPIICVPNLRETMTFKNTWAHSKKYLKETYTNELVDFSELDDDFWFLKTSQNT